MTQLLKREQLRNYQLTMIELGKKHQCMAWWVDMGMGKSSSSATLVSDLLENFLVLHVLIVAPKQVATITWPEQLQEWEHLRWMKWSLITGSQDQRIEAIMTRADIHIISQDNVDWLLRTVGKQWPWDMIILDEAHGFKNQSTRRWKAINSLRKANKYDRMIQLTATPSSQDIRDLWGQVYLLDGGQRLGTTEKAFNARWFEYSKKTKQKELKEGAEQEIKELLGDICFHLDCNDYLDMPELIHNRIEVDMPPKALAIYKQFERSLALQILELDLELEAANAAVLVGKLLQFANGAVYYNDAKDYKIIHNEKIEALHRVVENINGKPLLVGYQYGSDLQRLIKAFPKAIVMKNDPLAKDRWNNGDIQMLLAHPKSAGYGLNLQKGSNHMAFFGLGYSVQQQIQFIGRVHRQGQKEKFVMVHEIVARDTRDMIVLEVIKNNKATQKMLLDAVKLSFEQEGY